MILLAPSVQKELKLSDEQKTKVYNFARKASQKNREMMQSMAMAGGNANPQAMMQVGMQIRQETDKGIGEILDAKQKERLEQISLQAEGPLAVARPEIAAKLRLNEGQQNAVQEIMMQMRQGLFMAMRQGAANGQVNPAQMREMTVQYRKEAVNEISKVIDRKQQAAFNKLLGPKFDTAKLESEAASIDPNAADPQKSGDAPQAQAKDAPADGNEPSKEAAKKPSTSTRKKGRTKSGAGANR